MLRMCGVVHDGLKHGFCTPGQLVLRRHVNLPPPSHHAIHATCMQLLPLVEMYCKWELEEDCSDLQALMFRFDSEVELESHALGRSLLFMVKDDGCGIDSVPRQVPITAPTDPFRQFRERLAAAGSAIRELQQQVLPYPHLFCMCNLPVSLGVSTIMSLFWKQQSQCICVWHAHACALIWLPFQKAQQV